MKREIKFRARTQDEDTKDGWVYSETHGLSDFWHGVEEDRYIEETVGQFTGLKDKNGKEIYEGDIVSYLPYREGTKQEVCTVEWNQENVYFYPFGTGNSCEHCYNGPEQDYDNMGKYDVEVIGNVHENPELLDSKS